MPSPFPDLDSKATLGHRPGACLGGRAPAFAEPGMADWLQVLTEGGVMRLAGSDGSGDATGWQVFISHPSELRDFPKGMSYAAAVERVISAARHVIVDGPISRYGSACRAGVL